MNGLHVWPMSHSYIHCSYFQKYLAGVVFVALAFLVLKKQQGKQNVCVVCYTNWPFWESKWDEYERWVRGEAFRLDSQQYSNFQQQTRPQSHTRHCTSPSNSSIVCRVTIHVGFHRNNKMSTETKCKHSCHYRNVANCQKPQITSKVVAQILQNSTCSFCSV